MDLVWIVTGTVSVLTGIAGGLVGRQYIARLDQQRAARRDGSFLEIGERQIAAVNRPGREGS